MSCVISHFHADHTFGWPFLFLEIAQRRPSRPVHVVGPPGVEAFLVDMLTLGGLPGLVTKQRETAIEFVEVDGSWQQAGPLRFRAVEVEHVPYLKCFGYVFEIDGRAIAYSGDTRPCAGLDELAGAADVLILECNGEHPGDAPRSHMDVDAVRALRERHPGVPFVLTHLGPDVVASDISDVVVPNDFARLTI